MRKYRLKVLQKRNHENFSTYLLSILSDSNCVKVVSEPRQKSERKIPSPGVKWVDGVIEIKNHPDCFKNFSDRIFHNEYFNIALISLN
jgi:hypothetical protein